METVPGECEIVVERREDRGVTMRLIPVDGDEEVYILSREAAKDLAILLAKKVVDDA